MALAFLAVEAIMLLSFHLSANRAYTMRFYLLAACLLFLSACSNRSEKTEDKAAPPAIRTDDVETKVDAQTSKEDDGDDDDDNAPKPLGDIGDTNFLPNAFCLKVIDKENAIVNVTYRKYYVRKGKRYPLMSKPVEFWITGLSTENVKEYTAWNPRCEFMVIGEVEDKNFGTIRQIAPIVADK